METKIMTIVREHDFKKVASVKPDAKKRVVLPQIVLSEDVTYHVYVNNSGQIMLDPQVTVPAYEAWLFKNPEAMALVQQGLADATQDKISKVDLENL